MDLESVLGPALVATKEKPIRFDTAYVSVPADPANASKVILKILGQDTSCSRLKSYTPVKGEKALYVTVKNRGIVVLGAIA